MGNETSQQLKGLEIDKKAIEISDYWTLYSAEIPNEISNTKLSIFQGESALEDNLWGNINPLEKASKNLMIYRHPSIIKYIASWNRGTIRNLATERCRPLSLVLNQQTDIEICLGLKNILNALIFLVEQAGIRHLNVCRSSIYVTCDGSWKLGGFEFLWKANELTSDKLDKSKLTRYNKAVDAAESKTKGAGLEQYAFGIMCEELLNKSNEDSIPYHSEFKKYCTTHLKHATPSMRPKLSAILLHSYFNHEFIAIHTFLTEMPLKNQQEKQIFFTSLIDRLRKFDEELVASQLGNALLSRIVLLDSCAQLCVLPFLLKPKTDDLFPSLFTIPVYFKYIVPKIMEVFCVRDTQIRLILLEYFSYYVGLIPKDDLRDNLLPQLLLGIKDTNDVLVATTLRCLADLVAILGSSVVIGGNRTRIFADGRPQGPPEVSNHWIEARSITPVLTSVELRSSHSPAPDNVDISESYASVDNNSHGNLMPERFSPDGGEDFKTSEIDDETWTDWEEELDDHVKYPATAASSDDQNLVLSQLNDIMDNTSGSSNSKLVNGSVAGTAAAFATNKKQIPDIEELDIKNQKVIPKLKDEMDFFKDMEPVIQKTSILSLEMDTAAIAISSPTSTLNTPRLAAQIPNQTASADDESAPVIDFDRSRFEMKAAIDDEATEDGWEDDSENNEWGKV